jgi:hypothetical protein
LERTLAVTPDWKSLDCHPKQRFDGVGLHSALNWWKFYSRFFANFCGSKVKHSIHGLALIWFDWLSLASIFLILLESLSNSNWRRLRIMTNWRKSILFQWFAQSFDSRKCFFWRFLFQRELLSFWDWDWRVIDIPIDWLEMFPTDEYS